MKKYIDVALPQTPEALRAYADLLEGLSGQPDCCDTECTPDKAPDPAVATLPVPVPAAAVPPVPEPVAVPPVPDPEPVAVPPAHSGMAPPDMSILDSAGLPWDGRIHAATKTMMKGDGTWKKKRNSDPAEVEQVTAELRAAVLHATLPPTPVAVTPAAPAASVPPVPPVAAPPVPPVAVPPVPAAPEEMSFPSLVAEVTNKQNMGLITPEEVNAVAQQCGVPAFPVLASKPELIPTVHAALVAIWTPRTAS